MMIVGLLVVFIAYSLYEVLQTTEALGLDKKLLFPVRKTEFAEHGEGRAYYALNPLIFTNLNKVSFLNLWYFFNIPQYSKLNFLGSDFFTGSGSEQIAHKAAGQPPT